MENITGYTPGPWVIDGQDIIGNEPAGYVCTWSGRSANARLIAAAPDMLNELINFCDYNCTDCSGQTEGCSETCGLKNAKEIIERATGMKMQEVLGTARHDAERKGRFI